MLQPDCQESRLYISRPKFDRALSLEIMVRKMIGVLKTHASTLGLEDPAVCWQSGTIYNTSSRVIIGKLELARERGPNNKLAVDLVQKGSPLATFEQMRSLVLAALPKWLDEEDVFGFS